MRKNCADKPISWDISLIFHSTVPCHFVKIEPRYLLCVLASMSFVLNCILVCAAMYRVLRELLLRPIDSSLILISHLISPGRRFRGARTDSARKCIQCVGSPAAAIIGIVITPPQVSRFLNSCSTDRTSLRCCFSSSTLPPYPVYFVSNLSSQGTRQMPAYNTPNQQVYFSSPLLHLDLIF